MGKRGSCMKRKNRGAISIFALLSMMFFLVFIMVAYSNVVQKGKMQSETEAILIDYYKSFQTIDEAYTSIHKDEVRTAGRDCRIPSRSESAPLYC